MANVPSDGVVIPVYTGELDRPTGADRRDLPTLDEAGDAMRERLFRLARSLRDAMLVGKPAPIVAEMAERSRCPVEGDFGVVLDAMAMREGSEGRGFGLGILLCRRMEPLAEWDEDGPNPGEEVLYVQYGPDRLDVCRWHNANFVSLDLDTT